jgi:hypothetical protein
MPAKNVKLLSWPEPEANDLLEAARAAMPGATEKTPTAEIVRWALRVAPLASERARAKAAEPRKG